MVDSGAPSRRLLFTDFARGDAETTVVQVFDVTRGQVHARYADSGGNIRRFVEEIGAGLGLDFHNALVDRFEKMASGRELATRDDIKRPDAPRDAIGHLRRNLEEGRITMVEIGENVRVDQFSVTQFERQLTALVNTCCWDPNNQHRIDEAKDKARKAAGSLAAGAVAMASGRRGEDPGVYTTTLGTARG